MLTNQERMMGKLVVDRFRERARNRYQRTARL